MHVFSIKFTTMTYSRRHAFGAMQILFSVDSTTCTSVIRKAYGKAAPLISLASVQPSPCTEDTAMLVFHSVPASKTWRPEMTLSSKISVFVLQYLALDDAKRI